MSMLTKMLLIAILNSAGIANAHSGVLVPQGADALRKVELSEQLLIWRGNKEVAKTLIKLGANVNAIDAETGLGIGHSLVIVIAARKHTEETTEDLFRFYLQHGLDINARDQLQGNTALMIECDWVVRPRIVRFLLRHGADPRLKNNAGKTALDLVRALKANPERLEVIGILDREMKRWNIAAVAGKLAARRDLTLELDGNRGAKLRPAWQPDFESK